MMMNNDFVCRELIAKVESELCGFVSEKRLAHIFSVRKTALKLCDFFVSLGEEISRDSVELSALVHDITKCMDQEELCRRYGIRLSDDDMASPETVHAITGAHFAKERYGVSDEVSSSVEKHTVAGENMSLADKIIFVSDYCEETRSHSECRASRTELLDMMQYAEKLPESERLTYAKKKLDYICADILAKTVKYLQSRNLYVHGKTVSSYEHIISLYGDDSDFLGLSEKYREVMKKRC